MPLRSQGHAKRAVGEPTAARRLTSRKVALTAAFLALAAGGPAACDASADEERESDAPAVSSDVGDDRRDAGANPADKAPADKAPADKRPADKAPADEEYVSDDGEELTDQVFYCADEEGRIVDEDNCDDDDGTSSFLWWHSSGYPRNLKPGKVLDGGDSFPAGDREARRSFKLPATGRISNGTVKTNVVGRGSGSGLSGDSRTGSGSSGFGSGSSGFGDGDSGFGSSAGG